MPLTTLNPSFVDLRTVEGGSISASGVVYRLRRRLGASSTFSVIGGGSSFTVAGNVLSFTSGALTGSQTIVISETRGDVSVRYPVHFTVTSGEVVNPGTGTAYEALTLRRTTGPAEYPVAFELVRPYAASDADAPVAVMQRTQDPTFTSGITETTANLLIGTTTYDFGTDAINSGEWYFRIAAYKGSRPAVLNWSRIIGVGNATAPTITSSGTVNITQYVASTSNLTANRPGYWQLAGGQDVGIATLSSTTLAYLAARSGTLRVQVSFADYFGNTVTKMLNVVSAINVPSDFVFSPVTKAELATIYKSETITIAGLAAGSVVPYGLSGTGSVSKNGGAFSTKGGTITNGDTLQVQMASNAAYTADTTTTLTVGNKSVVFKISTKNQTSDVNSIVDNVTYKVTNTENYTYNSLTLPPGYSVIAIHKGHYNITGVTFKGAPLAQLGLTKEKSENEVGGHYYLFGINNNTETTGDLVVSYPYEYNDVDINIQVVGLSGISSTTPTGVTYLQPAYHGNPQTYQGSIGTSGTMVGVVFAFDSSGGNFVWADGITPVSSKASTSGNAVLKVGRFTAPLTPSFTSGDGYNAGIAAAFSK